MTVLRYAILSAVSTREQAARDKTSIQDQIDAARQHCGPKGWNESAGPFVIPGQSRTRYLNLRDAEGEIQALRDLLDAAARSRYDLLVVYDHDRLRDLLGLVYAALSDYGVQLYSLAQPIQPVEPGLYDPDDSDTNLLLIGLSDIRSKAEIKRMRRKYRLGMRKRVEVHGLPVQIPYGYRKPPGQVYNRQAVPEPVPEIAPHLLHIKDLFLAGRSIRQLSDYLTAQRLPPPRSATWHPNTVRDILRNPFYAGIVRFEVSKVVHDRRKNRTIRDRKPAPDKIVTGVGKHVPLWDAATLRALLAEFDRRRKNYRGRQNNQFTGLLRCGLCDASLWRQRNGPRSVPERLIWRCSANPQAHVGIPHVHLLAKVGATLVTALQPYFTAMQTDQPPAARPVTDQSALDDLLAQKGRLLDLYQHGIIDVATLETRILQLDQKIDATRTACDDAQERQTVRAAWLKQTYATLGQQAVHLPRWLAHNDPQETNVILHLLFEKIVITPQGDDWKVELVYKK